MVFLTDYAQGSVVSSIGRAIKGIVSAVANLIMIIVDAIITVRPSELFGLPLVVLTESPSGSSDDLRLHL